MGFRLSKYKVRFFTSIGSSGLKSNFSSSAFHHGMKSGLVAPSLVSQSLKERLVQETLKNAISNSPNLVKQGLHSSGGGSGGSGSSFGPPSMKSGLSGGAANSLVQQSIKTEITAGSSKIGGNSLSSSMAMLTTESKIHHNHHHSSSSNAE